MITLGIFWHYLIESSLILIALVLVYMLCLRTLRRHNLKRMILLGMVVVSLTLPLISLPEADPIIAIEQIPQSEMGYSTIAYSSAPEADIFTLSNFFTLLLYIYIALSLAIFMRTLYTYLKLYRFIGATCGDFSSAEISLIKALEQRMGISGTVRYRKHHSHSITPFSFLRTVVISQSDILENSTQEILTHELQHVRRGHSFDILFINVLQVVFWFNPALWLLKRELREVHEFDADRAAVENTSDLQAYQLLLIEKTLGTTVTSALSNNFNTNQFKTRLMMMKQTKTTRRALCKAMLALPLALCAPAVVMAAPVENFLDEVERTTYSMPTLGTPEDNVVYIVDGEVVENYDNNPENIAEINVLKWGNEEINKVIRSYNVPDGSSIIIVSSKEKANKIAIPSNTAYLIDGKLVSEAEFGKISPDNINKIEVLKSGEQLAELQKKYNLNEDQAVIMVTLKSLPIIVVGDAEVNDDELAVMSAEVMPKFQDGELSRFRAWCAQRLSYPELAQKEKIQGCVLLSFVIEKDGTVSNVTVVRGVHEVLDAEAVRVIKSSPKWIPAQNNGKAVLFMYNMPIDFVLQ
ncbi:MAG: M56 family metallopeptidase [Rikenellaceae bacterium]